MNDQERQVITDIFRRLEQVANQPRDPEAEAFIAENIRRQPYAPYAMAQAIFVQEQALAKLHAENEALRSELENERRRPQQGGFLSGIFGGGPSAPEPAYREPPRQASPWGQPQPQPQPQPYPQQPFGGPQGGMAGGPGPWGGMQRGGGFLSGALTTAAGVAGGMVIANALSHAFGGAGAAAQSAFGDRSALAGLDNAPGSDSSGNTDNAGITDALYPNQQDEEPPPDDWDADGDGGDEGDWV